MTLSSIFILDERGQVLVFRHYRDYTNVTSLKRFYNKLVLNIEEGNVKPIIITDDKYFLYIKHNNIFIVGVCSSDSNIAMSFCFLYKMRDLFIDYFHALEEESVRDNYVIIYELLDEIIDNGYPQFTEPKILQQFITQESYKLEVNKPPPAVTNAVSWRGENIVYKNNQIYVDVVEHINCQIAKDGTVLSCDINGVLKCDCQLSGMPELRMGFNDLLSIGGSAMKMKNGSHKIELEDIKFHQCVRLASFHSDRRISFIPPDGKFELMSYRIPYSGKPPFLVTQKYDLFKSNRIKFTVKVLSTFKIDVSASNVMLKIPVPPDIISPKFVKTNGECEYEPAEDAIFWSLKSFNGQKENILNVEVCLPSITQQYDPKKPISVIFELNYYAASRLQIKYMKISEKSGYEGFPWARYVTYNGDYQVRTV